MFRNDYIILVVEDAPLIRMEAVDFLVEAGFQVLEAETADQAIDVLEVRSDINLVFTDVGMPGVIDGITLSHYIRNRWPPVKLIAVSGLTILDANQLPVGAKFFAKPYDEENVLQTIFGMLSDISDAHTPYKVSIALEHLFR